MQKADWQLKNPIKAVLFDCDGTLSQIEGIDELAKMNEVGDSVQAITADAMGKTGINQELYEQRLNLVKPTEQQVLELGQLYFDYQVPDAAKIIKILTRLNKSIFLISAGLKPAVTRFGELLKIPQQNIFSVQVMFDKNGNYLDFDRNSPLTCREGKRTIVVEIKKQFSELVYVGDGLNDLAVLDLVNRFVGFGGYYYRENIAAQSDFYICTPSLAALLPLVLTEDESKHLDTEEWKVYEKGIREL